MAYSELVSFIREELNQGKDPVTVRQYLLNRNIDPRAIDHAFDEIFGKNQQSKGKSSAEIAIIAGVFIFMVVLIGGGFLVYDQIGNPLEQVSEPTSSVEMSDTNPEVQQPTPPEEMLGSDECDFEQEQEKYACYVKKFESNTLSCSELENVEERNFCYRAYDIYRLEA